MTFRSPQLLVALVAVPVLAVGYVRVQRWRGQRAHALAASALVPVNGARLGFRRHVPYVLALGGVTLLLAALARPEVTIDLPHRSGTLLVVVDSSNSMSADDADPTRLDAAKDLAATLISEQPDGVEVGVVTFGDGAFVTQAPTTDRGDVWAAVDRLEPTGDTAIGEGLYVALTAITGELLPDSALSQDQAEIDFADLLDAAEPGYHPDSTIVLLSDGENTSPPDPAALIDVAATAGVQIHTIGIGTVEGTVIDVDGHQLATSLNRELLEEIAVSTNGQAFTADDITGIDDIVSRRWTTSGERTEVTAVAAGGGLLFLLAGAATAAHWFGRIP